MKNFTIVLIQEQPDQPYHSGSKVTGNLIAEVDESKSYEYISVAFRGGANCHWSERRTSGSGNSRRSQVHHYSSSESYADVEIKVWTKEESADGKFGPGTFTFPFEFTIPPDAPSSFEGSYGRIRYEIQGRAGTGLLKFDHKTEVRIPVQQSVPVNAPELQEPVRQELQKTICCLCCASGPIVMTVDLPKTGYCIGETVPLRVSVENGSSRQIQMFAHLIRNVVFRAQGHAKFGTKTVEHATSSNDHVGANATQDWSPTITIPSTEVFNEQSCHIIQMHYFLKVVASISGAVSLTANIPVKLGNVQEAT